ncbi:hypothetical protein SNEBB_008985 [Seison nebaliae]|nr:hypothetical protein SNEBB_008985 [Seison nebaliae]
MSSRPKIFNGEKRNKIDYPVSSDIRERNPEFFSLQKHYVTKGVLGFNKSVYEMMKKRTENVWKKSPNQRLQPDPKVKRWYSYKKKEWKLEGTLDSVLVTMANSKGILFYDRENARIPAKKMAVFIDMEYIVISCTNSYFDPDTTLPDCESHLVTPSAIMVRESADLALDFYFSYFNAKLNPTIPFAFISQDGGFMNLLNYSIDSPRKCYIISPNSNNFGVLTFPHK